MKYTGNVRKGGSVGEAIGGGATGAAVGAATVVATAAPAFNAVPSVPSNVAASGSLTSTRQRDRWGWENRTKSAGAIGSTSSVGTTTPAVTVKRICTGNNTIRTAWNHQTGKTLKSLSCGRVNFRGARRGTPYAAERVGRTLGEQIAGRVPGGKVAVTFEGVHTAALSGRRGLKQGGVKILSISEQIRVPHNGCRRRKPRRT